MKIKRIAKKGLVLALVGGLLNLAPAYAKVQTRHYNEYKNVIRRTASMVGDNGARRLAQKYGLNILNVTWEDTGRYKNSSVGPNISDMTIQVQQRDPSTDQYSLTCMPVIRYPNFSDKTGDVDLDKFYLLVGNEKDQDLERVTLREFLGNMRKYLTDPHSWNGRETSLLADRDTHALVSAQACFLPIPKKGVAEFNPVIFNYQSYEDNPAVLTILATREGTSVTIIDNKRDEFEAGRTWGQRLFYNKDGERCSFTGERLSDFVANPDNGYTANSSPKEKEGLSMVLLIQVPLKQKPIKRQDYMLGGCFDMMVACETAAPALEKCRSNVENAVIGHGKVEGPFTEIDDLKIERDPRYPIRVTVQFYKATSNGVVSAKDMREISKQINKVYDQADYVGSLVVDGNTYRPTEYTGCKHKPANWWENFWRRHEENTGQCKCEAQEMLDKLLGIKKAKERQQWGIIEEPITQ